MNSKKLFLMRIFTLLTALLIGTALSSFKGSKTVTVTSTAFSNNGAIPVKYTCLGPEFSPPLQFSNIPPETKSIVIIVVEPDATVRVTQQKVCVPEKTPAKTKSKRGKHVAKKSTAPLYETVNTKTCFTHWLIWNIEPNSNFIPENFINENQGLNSVNECRYKGMCPTNGTHNYHFKVYALDTKLNISKKSDRVTVEKVMEGHILAWGEVVGTFNKNYK
jgi:Raf kinase inhibitor-like YbhB/YbcL family protein